MWNIIVIPRISEVGKHTNYKDECSCFKNNGNSCDSHKFTSEFQNVLATYQNGIISLSDNYIALVLEKAKRKSLDIKVKMKTKTILEKYTCLNAF